MNESNNVEITVSYSRKLNHDLYGGNQYESSDHFCSLKIVTDEETDPKEAHKELSELAKEMVDGRVEEEMMAMDGGIPKAEFNKMLDNFITNKAWGGAEDYERMSQYQQNIFQVIKRAKKRVKYADEKLTDNNK